MVRILEVTLQVSGHEEGSATGLGSGCRPVGAGLGHAVVRRHVIYAPVVPEGRVRCEHRDQVAVGLLLQTGGMGTSTSFLAPPGEDLVVLGHCPAGVGTPGNGVLWTADLHSYFRHPAGEYPKMYKSFLLVPLGSIRMHRSLFK